MSISGDELDRALSDTPQKRHRRCHFATTAPVHIMQRLYDSGHLNYSLVLAHDIVKPENRDAYENLFLARHQDCVILDNSVIELGKAVDIDMLQDAALIVQPSTIVIPDSMLNARETVDAAEKFLADAEVVSFNPLAWQTVRRQWEGFMYVPQGKTFEEWCWCAEVHADDDRIGWWGIPRNMRKQLGRGARHDAVHVCKMLAPNRRIHLLGFSDDIVDDMFAARHPFVASIDSTVPIRMATTERPFHMTQYIPPRGDWWDNAHWNEAIPLAIETVQGWINAR